MIKITIGTAVWSNQNVHSIWKLRWVSHAPHAAISLPFGFKVGYIMNWRVQHFKAMHITPKTRHITLKTFECSKGVMMKITIGTAAWSNQNVHSIWNLRWVSLTPHAGISRPLVSDLGTSWIEACTISRQSTYLWNLSNIPKVWWSRLLLAQLREAIRMSIVFET